MAAKSAVLKDIPKSESLMVSYYSHDKRLLFRLTEKNSSKGTFCLYEVKKDGTYQLLGKGNSPTALEEKFSVEKKMKKGMPPLDE